MHAPRVQHQSGHLTAQNSYLNEKAGFWKNKGWMQLCVTSCATSLKRKGWITSLLRGWKIKFRKVRLFEKTERDDLREPQDSFLVQLDIKGNCAEFINGPTMEWPRELMASHWWWASMILLWARILKDKLLQNKDLSISQISATRNRNLITLPWLRHQVLITFSIISMCPGLGGQGPLRFPPEISLGFRARRRVILHFGGLHCLRYQTQSVRGSKQCQRCLRAFRCGTKEHTKWSRSCQVAN